MKIAVLFLSLVVAMVACRSAKKVQKIQQATSKAETSFIVVHENKKEDSLNTSANIYNKVVKNRIDFTTFSAKVKVGYESKEGSDEVTVFIRMKSDSVIWLSFRGALGIEGFRVLITKDSVKVMNLLKKNIQFRSISYIQNITDIPFDFKTLQDLIIGNPVFIDSNIVSYKVNANNEIVISMSGQLFRHLVTLDNSDNKLLHSKLNDANTQKNRTCDITYSNYESSAGFMFSTKRKISVAEQSKLDISLDFKQYSFNPVINFPFNIPKNYKRL